MNEFSVSDYLFQKLFGSKDFRHFVSYGRLEIIGNHTDHQRGHCIVATCSQGIRGAVKAAEGNLIELHSDGYGTLSFNLNDLSSNPQETGSPLSLVKGVLAYLKEKGYRIGAFKAAITSDIYKGAGVSSSAAFELFVAEVENVLYNEGKIPNLVKAQAGRYAENVYFGKASGLLDQCGSAFGGMCFLDFTDLNNPLVKALPLPSWPMKIYIVNPGSSHSRLSNLYSEMPNDMKSIASSLFGKEVLSEVKLADFFSQIHTAKVNDRARLRALHFFEEDARVLRAKKAIETDNFDWFLELEKESQLSQMSLLHNVMVQRHYEKSPLEAVERAKVVLKRGSARVMGGGLAGSIICFVPNEEEELFLNYMNKHYHRSNILNVNIPPLGAHEEK